MEREKGSDHMKRAITVCTTLGTEACKSSTAAGWPHMLLHNIATGSCQRACSQVSSLDISGLTVMPLSSG